MREIATLFAILLLAPAWAGCLAADAQLPLTSLADSVQEFGGSYTFPPPVTLRADGTPAPSPFAADEMPHAVQQLVPGLGAEPNIGITSSGSIFVTTYDQVRRSRDHGQSWDIVHDFTTPEYPRTLDVFSTADPMLWVDTDTDRVYASHMHPALLCTYMAWSDDDGDTWTERPLACGAIPGIDHQKVMTAPPAQGLPMTSYPNVLYICNNKRFNTILATDLSMGTSCIVSLDGGMTYPYEREAYITDRLCSNVNGHPAAYADGTVVMILGSLGTRCERPLTAVLSEDNGLTWTTRQCDADLGQVEIDADITITPDGTAYVLYRDHDQMTHLLRTRDKFLTCEHWRVAPPTHTLSVFTGITSGDNGRIAMAYLGTQDPQNDGATPSNATPGTQWHAYITTSHDADADEPTFSTQQATPQEDPVQVGCIWLGGGGGGPERCRNLLDFIDMTHDADGRYVAAITIGCTPRNGCTGTPEQSDFQSRDSQIAILIQDRGASLLAHKGNLPPLGLEHPRPHER